MAFRFGFPDRLIKKWTFCRCVEVLTLRKPGFYLIFFFVADKLQLLPRYEFWIFYVHIPLDLRFILYLPISSSYL